MAVLNLHKVAVDVAGRTLVQGVCLSVQPGQILAIIGPNGAGKTTLLRAISAELAPAAGHIDFNGRPIGDWPAAERAVNLAVLTQANPLSFAFTVEEVVALGRTPHSTGIVADQQVCREAITALDLEHLAQRVYPSLSGGEQQRVQLARVMAQIWRNDGGADRLLLLDEPVTSLDLGHQRQLMRAVRAFADSGVGVVMVMHDISLASAYSDSLLALKSSQVVAQGTPEQVVTEALIGDLFDTEVRVIAHPVSGKPMVLGV